MGESAQNWNSTYMYYVKLRNYIYTDYVLIIISKFKVGFSVRTDLRFFQDWSEFYFKGPVRSWPGPGQMNLRGLLKRFRTFETFLHVFSFRFDF